MAGLLSNWLPDKAISKIYEEDYSPQQYDDMIQYTTYQTILFILAVSAGVVFVLLVIRFFTSK